MVRAEEFSYEMIYFTLWELGQRYGNFCQFRVIGKSHDDRMIPMLEIGTGEKNIFCLSGVDGRDADTPIRLCKIAELYCKNYECEWLMDDLYDVKKLLNNCRICLIPLLNPDGYEICRRDFRAIRNPIYRQMLRMQRIPSEEFSGNARGIVLGENFPMPHYEKRKLYEEPGSENETKALIRIFREYDGTGLFSFQKNRTSAGRIWPKKVRGSLCTPEHFFTQRMHQPAFVIQADEKDENDVSLLPLEFIFSSQFF